MLPTAPSTMFLTDRSDSLMISTFGRGDDSWVSIVAMSLWATASSSPVRRHQTTHRVASWVAEQ